MVSVFLQRSSNYTGIAVLNTEKMAPTFWGRQKDDSWDSLGITFFFDPLVSLLAVKQDIVHHHRPVLVSLWIHRCTQVSQPGAVTSLQPWVFRDWQLFPTVKQYLLIKYFSKLETAFEKWALLLLFIAWKHRDRGPGFSLLQTYLLSDFQVWCIALCPCILLEAPHTQYSQRLQLF